MSEEKKSIAEKDTIILDEDKLPAYSYGADTELLEDALMMDVEYETFSSKYKNDIGVNSFVTAMRKLMNVKKIDFAQIPAKISMNRSYFYQIANGTRSPSRDKVIMIAFALRATFDEANNLLNASEKQTLYARSKRDSCIIYSLNHKYSLEECNKLLQENKHQILS